jgi:hypothetical protein
MPEGASIMFSYEKELESRCEMLEERINILQGIVDNTNRFTVNLICNGRDYLQQNLENIENCLKGKVKSLVSNWDDNYITNKLECALCYVNANQKYRSFVKKNRLWVICGCEKVDTRDSRFNIIVNAELNNIEVHFDSIMIKQNPGRKYEIEKLCSYILSLDDDSCMKTWEYYTDT